MVSKSIIEQSRYVCCVLDYAEDLMAGMIEPEDVPNLKIQEDIDIKGVKLSLVSVIYFQEMHYNMHIKAAQHPKFLHEKRNVWYFHDGKGNGTYKNKFVSGLLYEDSPKLEVDSCNDNLRPYVLVYRAESINTQ